MTPDTIETPELSLEDELRAAFEAANEPEAEETAPEPEATSDEPEAPSEDRTRDEKGRFVAKEPAEPTELAEAPEPAVEEKEEKPQVDPYALAPEKWGTDVKAQWNELPAAVREQIIKREKEVHQQFTRYDEERNFGKAARAVVAPYEGYIKSMGADPIKAFDYLLKTDYALRTAAPEQRRQLLIKAAADYGIDLNGSVLQDSSQPVQQPANDPRYETMQQQVQYLSQQLNDVTNRYREGEDRKVHQTIADFMASPDHPFVERVADVMALLLDSGQASTLEAAYEMAVYANHETRALHLQAERAAEDRKRQERADIARAKNASGSVTGAPGSNALPTPTNSAGSVEDDVREAIRAVSNRI